MLAVNFPQKKLTGIKKRWQNLGSTYTGEMKKRGAEPEDEGGQIPDEIHLPTVFILRLLNSWDTKLA